MEDEITMVLTKDEVNALAAGMMVGYVLVEGEDDGLSLDLATDIFESILDDLGEEGQDKLLDKFPSNSSK